ncbi:MAG TPA: isoprenyl transferase [Candidatus Omnitrophota bacterium]|nr:isoprenyl transferase [Candidatus Omnitrophota bacterium]
MEELIKERLPKHVAIIMDGNGRWAKERNLSRSTGHIEGVKRVEEIVDYANEIGIKIMTLYTFSTENWNRPASEVELLLKILTTVLERKINKLIDTNIRFQTIGRRERIPKSVLDMIDTVVEKTKHNDRLVMNLAFNYGSRLEIVDAIQAIAQKVKDGLLDVKNINEETVNQHLYTKNLPDPDLLIRTSGELRISNFLLWQLSYAEFYFTEKYWPEFTQNEFKNALLAYQKRQRRFGGIGEPKVPA